MQRPLHHPPHILVDNTWYFLTAHTLSEQDVGFADFKYIWINTIKELSKKFNYRLYAWVILSNHYHTLFKVSNSQDLPIFINRLHGSTSYYINKKRNSQGKKIWHNYWDQIIRDKEDFWTKFNYIHYNPVKHGYVNNPFLWEYSSFRGFLQKKGEPWIRDCWQTYPILEYDFE
jgi:putative transposase